MSMKLRSETQICVISFSADLFLAAVKFLFGRLFDSDALISDSVHSCADAFTSFFTIIGTLPHKDGTKKEKAEKLTLHFICTVLFLTGSGMLFNAVRDIIDGNVFSSPPLIASCVCVFSLAVKETLFFFSRYASRKFGSKVLYAQAWHHQSDALSCVGSFIGVFGASLGLPVLDKAASIVISVMIMKTAVDIFKSSGKN